MKFETLRNNKKILLASVIVFVVILTLIISTSLAKYKVTESINIANGTINYSPSDLTIMAIYIKEDGATQYTSVDEIPEGNFVINNDNSYCKVRDTNINVTLNYEASTKTISIAPFTQKNTKCYLYFDAKGNLSIQDIISSRTVSERTDFSTTLTSDTTGVIYTALDDDGTSYYFAGAPTDNWVKFAGFYWRIIRINGDGTMRLIYEGTTTRTNGTSSSTTQIETSAFNTSNNNNMYVGYMYTSGTLHGLGTESAIKKVLDTWYNSNLTDNASHIDANAGFCGDRSLYSGTGLGTTETYYAPWRRLHTTKVPTLKCESSTDLYTPKSSIKGNKVLTNPIGLITIDEAMYAGGVFNTANSAYYLYTGNHYWTISPYYYANNISYVIYVHNGGYLGHYVGIIPSSNVMGVRPVINLRADTQFKKGTLGTVNSPYEVI